MFAMGTYGLRRSYFHGFFFCFSLRQFCQPTLLGKHFVNSKENLQSFVLVQRPTPAFVSQTPDTAFGRRYQTLLVEIEFGPLDLIEKSRRSRRHQFLLLTCRHLMCLSNFIRNFAWATRATKGTQSV